MKPFFVWLCCLVTVDHSNKVCSLFVAPFNTRDRHRPTTNEVPYCKLIILYAGLLLLAEVKLCFIRAEMTALKNLAADTQMQNFWTEAINKEANVRFEWQLRYSKEFAKGAVKCHPKKKAMQLNDSLSQKIKELEGSAVHSPTTLSPTIGKSSPRASPPLVDMSPANSNVRGLLYDGISRHGEGRYNYLRKRLDIPPDKKYCFPLLSSMNYGWKILDFVTLKPSCHGRTAIVRDTFYKSSGVMLA